MIGPLRTQTLRGNAGPIGIPIDDVLRQETLPVELFFGRHPFAMQSNAKIDQYVETTLRYTPMKLALLLAKDSMLQFPFSPMIRQLLHLVPTFSGWIHSNMTPQKDGCSDMRFSRKNVLAKIRMMMMMMMVMVVVVLVVMVVVMMMMTTTVMMMMVMICMLLLVMTIRTLMILMILMVMMMKKNSITRDEQNRVTSDEINSVTSERLTILKRLSHSAGMNCQVCVRNGSKLRNQLRVL